MQFVINTFNHNALGKRSLEDPISIIGHQLQALKHQVIFREENDQWVTRDAGINLVVEGFVPGSTAVIAELYGRGARFVCIATEEPTPKGFNHGKDLEMIKRQAEFPNTAKYLDGILCLVPGDYVKNWYGQYAPTRTIELGYAPTLIRRDYTEPTYDFGFFGSLSYRRERILKRLARFLGSEKTIRVEATFPSQLERDKAMREARVILQIRKHTQMGLVSSTRCNTALCLGRPVIAEPHEHCKPWDEVIRFSKTEESFYSEAILMKTAWKGVYMDQFAKFTEKFTPERCIGQALREIGVLDDVRAVA